MITSSLSAPWMMYVNLPSSSNTVVVRPIAWIFGYLEDPKKPMVGTDWPLVSMKPYVEPYKRAIPKQHWKAVFHDNAVTVFKLQDTR